MKINPARGKLLTVFYHDIFDYPLLKYELSRWVPGEGVLSIKSSVLGTLKQKVEYKRGFYYLEGREEIIAKRRLNAKSSKNKLKIAKRAGKLLDRIPTVMFVGITGSLAMMNSNDDSDIDLLIITSKGTLWTTRLITYSLLLISGFGVRRPKNKEEKDRLCLNMWIDERDLKFTKRNVFTAHEVAQIVSIVNNGKTYEKLLWENRWILDYWPKAVEIGRIQQVACRMTKRAHAAYYMLLATLFEPVAFKLQYLYMKPKITRETVTKTRAFFHPNDWSRKVLGQLDKIKL